MWNSFATTVSTPAKWPGRTAPSSSRAQRARVDRRCRRPRGYMSSTPGANTSSTPSSRQTARSGFEGAGVAREVLVRPELQRVDEDRHDGRPPRRACGGRAGSARGGPRAARPSSGRAPRDCPRVRSARVDRGDARGAGVDGELACGVTRPRVRAVVARHGVLLEGGEHVVRRRARAADPPPLRAVGGADGQDPVGGGQVGVDGVELAQVRRGRCPRRRATPGR